MTTRLSRREQDSLLGSLASSSEEVRRLAVEQLLLLPAEEAVPHLVECLGDPAWRVRKAAIERLVACRDDAILRPGLLAALADGENPGRRNAAFEAFVAMDRRSTPPLVEATSSPDVDVRKLAVDALAAIGDTAAREVLVCALGDPDANVRAAGADALGVVGGVAAVNALLRTARDEAEVPLVRLAALRSLERLEASVGVDTLADALAHPQLRPAALELLGHSTDRQALDELEKGLVSSLRSVREGAIGALLRQLARVDGAEADALCERLRSVSLSDPSLVERCCEGLRGGDLSRRIALIQILGVIADQRAVLPLLRIGRDEALRELVDATLEGLGAVTAVALEPVWGELELDLEARACGILGKLGGAVAEVLLASTLEDPGARSVGQAAMALGDGGYFGRMPELVRRLEAVARSGADESGDDVELLVSAVVRMAERAEAADPAVCGPLIEVLASRLGGAPEALRIAIARVLAQIGREQDMDLIVFLAKDASPRVRRAAVQAWSRFGASPSREAIRLALGDEASGVRIAAAAVLGRSGSREALADLERLSHDGDPRVAAAAIRAAGELLGRMSDATPQDAAWVGRAVSGEALVALAALEALARLGGPIAVSGAASALSREEPEIVRAAIACLAGRGANDDLWPLLELLAHPDWTVRGEVVRVLAARRVRRALPAMLRRLDLESDAFVREALLAAARKLEE